MREDIRYWIALNRISSITPHRFKRLVDAFSKTADIFSSSIRELAERSGLQEKYCQELIESKNKVLEQAEKDIEFLTKTDISVLTYKDDGYPRFLLQIHSFPPILYMKGSFQESDENAIGIVGTRKPSPYGLTMAKTLAAGLVQRGVTVVSGLAKGIDTISHQSALEEKGRTIAVLGCGIDVDYPRGSVELKEKIKLNGAVITEFPVGTYPAPFNFPVRNRIISGLSLGIVVVEAAEKSGALITADYALQQDREVYAVPGPVTLETSKGPNRLIKQGAKLVESVDDIIEEVLPQSSISKAEKLLAHSVPAVDLPDNEKRCLEQIGIEPVHIDLVIEKTGLSSQEVSISLLTLELEGIITQVAGKRYQRNY
jgi:DNA processing protein